MLYYRLPEPRSLDSRHPVVVREETWILDPLTRRRGVVEESLDHVGVDGHGLQ